MRRVMFAAPWVLLAYGAPLSMSHGAAAVSECVQVEPEAVAGGMSLRVTNTCAFTVKCELSWRVRCEGDAADAAGRDGSAELRLSPEGRRTILASGEACGEQTWEITDDAWECRQVK